MSATRIFWGQVIGACGILLVAIWTATEWTAWQLGFQPELGHPWFALLDFTVYPLPAFIWWWFAYDAYAPRVFIEGAYIAASGGVIAAAVAIVMSVWRAREARNAQTYADAGYVEPSRIRRVTLCHWRWRHAGSGCWDRRVDFPNLQQCLNGFHDDVCLEQDAAV